MTDAQRELAEKNTSLVWLILYKHFSGNYNQDELVSAGYLGLCRAAQTWDATKCTFCTYASQVIRNAMLNEIRDRNKAIPQLSLETEIYDDLHLEEVLASDEEIEITDITFDKLLSKLSDTEIQVFKLLADGYRVKEIMEITNLSFNQVKWIKKKLKKKYLEVQKSK